MEDIVDDNIEQENSVLDWVMTGIAPVVVIYGSSYFTIDYFTNFWKSDNEQIAEPEIELEI